MKDLPVSLKVVIFDKNVVDAEVLRAIVSKKEDVEDVEVVGQAASAQNALRRNGFNSVFIDIFSVGVKEGIDFIEDVRREHPVVPICLYSSSHDLVTMEGVSERWRERFGHYFKLFKNQTVRDLDSSVETMLYTISRSLQSSLAERELSELVSSIDSGSLTEEQRRKLEEVASAAESALASHRTYQQYMLKLVPGVNTGHVEQLVNTTLRDSSRSLRLTARVNIGVLAVGCLLVVGSFIVWSITGRLEAAAFGTLGMAGVVTALITNPLTSISFNARRLVQVQVAYLGFLSQLALLNQDVEDVTVIERSKQLGDEMARTLKALEDHFGK